MSMAKITCWGMDDLEPRALTVVRLHEDTAGTTTTVAISTAAVNDRGPAKTPRKRKQRPLRLHEPARGRCQAHRGGRARERRDLALERQAFARRPLLLLLLLLRAVVDHGLWKPRRDFYLSEVW